MTATNNESYTDCERRQIALTIVGQIPMWLKGAVGYKHVTCLPDTLGVRFDVRGRGPYRVAVGYDAGADLYDMTVTTMSRAPRTILDAEGIGPEEMVNVIDAIDRGRLTAAGWSE